MSTTALPATALRRRCDPATLAFTTTAELEGLDGFVGQDRALEAIRFAIDIRHPGYNLYAIGPAGSGKSALVLSELRHRAATTAPAHDWCYVHNFDHPHRPRALRLAPGQASRLAKDMERLIKNLERALRRTFESDDYRNRVRAIEHAFEQRQEQAFAEIDQQARARGVALLRTQEGLSLAPLREGKAMPPDAFAALTPEQRGAIETEIEQLREQLHSVLDQVARWKRHSEAEIDRLNSDQARDAIAHLFAEFETAHPSSPELLAHLHRVEDDVIGHFEHFLDKPQPPHQDTTPWQQRYRVNALLSHQHGRAAPVIQCDLPSTRELVGRIEHRAVLGTLETDFTMIRAGALHRANGGYLVIEARKLLSQPFAWETLKRALQSGEIRFDPPDGGDGPLTTVALEPEPIPLALKVVLLGEHRLYALLAEADPEFEELFKVSAEFEERMPRDPAHEHALARLIATWVQASRLRHFSNSAVARVIEHSARLAGERDHLSGQMRALTDLVHEADHHAATRDAERVEAEDVEQAIAARRRRCDRISRRIREAILEDTLRIATTGRLPGQVNGLAVVELGANGFGHPVRISASARAGDGDVIDIEREVELGGPIHSKGVMILSGFIAGRYARHHPLSLTASLVFEQSYGPVDGDSASAAELCALLSALSGLPIRQSLAITGSIDQYGAIQAIGGVNEKIEGFFALCQARGLDGEQGVLIPTANVRQLMLSEALVTAVEAGTFSIHAVADIDQAIALLTDTPAGIRDAHGAYPTGSVNQRVEQALIDNARLASGCRRD
ncbi:Lon protease family protein [Marichromatium bheemlicum]|uniref:endopeptidase La n=1 Tax=Marichromatium bheemlicum TaxID=365339 RepID=A0ABX1I8G9_9GAMM|nr:ATP-binding protein [Marichromatium bheemlicum]NKN32505.1 AAA family ATPase [Marichromatium bheemlicum]